MIIIIWTYRAVEHALRFLISMEEWIVNYPINNEMEKMQKTISGSASSR